MAPSSPSGPSSPSSGATSSSTGTRASPGYVWGNSGSLPIVLYDGNYCLYGLRLIAKTDSQDGQLYYLADGLAGTTGLTDGEGSVVGTYTYDLFGAIRSETDGRPNDYRASAQQLDSATASYLLPLVKTKSGFKCRELP